MEYEHPDSSGTDDDLPPSHQNRVQRGSHVSGTGRSAVVGSAPYPRLHTDMEAQIYHLEQEAYRSVLLAFKAQSDTTITWEKTSLMAELRKELNISEDEHKTLLGRVDADDNLRRIREWRQSGGLRPGLHGASQPFHDSLSSPTFSASRKKQKTSHAVPSLSLRAPASALHPQTAIPSISAAKRGSLPIAKGRKPKSSIQYPSTVSNGRGQVYSGPLLANEPAQTIVYDDSLIGRKVRIRWPDDNCFYEAVVTEFKEGRHALVYDLNSPNTMWEWVNFNEISPQDIRWDGETPGNSRGLSHEINKSVVVAAGALPDVGREMGACTNNSRGEFPPLQNGIANKASGDIEILRTDKLIKEVEKIFEANRPDPLELEKAKKALKEHEQTLVDAIARLADAYDGKTGEGENPASHGESVDGEGLKNQQYNGNQYPADINNNGSDGDQMTKGGSLASNDQQDDDDL
ncbi:Emsy-like [Thalictrum thalictroides]|uniref:Emsy-like n=1 Tax=Thalictrum thalictroides TaxID=46969 RepID=A0A7J6WA30_THATH|nr:Emsy-like [Thalictrum thalictroides]